MRTSRKQHRRGTHQGATISLTPLIDMSLTLLVIFMVATPMIHRAIKVELPKGHMDEVKKTQQKQEVVVHIDKKELLYLNGNRVAKADFIPALKRLMQQSNQELVTVKADEAVPYGTVIALVDMIKHTGGVLYVALATQKQRAS